MASTGKNWVDIVGFQHEPVHTGVLQWLLESEPHRGLVAEALGVQEFSIPACVRREQPAPGGRRPADLLARFGAEGNPSEILVVEVKVDSLARESQVDALTCKTELPPCRHVLLAVGAEGLRLFGMTSESLRLNGNGWRLLDIRQWLKVLDRLDGLPGPVQEYRESVRGEVRLHDDARGGAHAGREAPSLCPRQALVYAWAWLREAAEALPRGMARCAPKMEARTGPTLYLWDVWDKARKDWEHEAAVDNFGFWLELQTGFDRRQRRAAIKAGARHPEHRQALVRLGREHLAPDGEWEVGGSRAKTTLFHRNLDSLPSSAVAEVCDEVITLAAEQGKGLLEEAYGSATPAGTPRQRP